MAVGPSQRTASFSPGGSRTMLARATQSARYNEATNGLRKRPSEDLYMNHGFRPGPLLAAVTLATLGAPAALGVAQATGPVTIRVELVSVPNGKMVKLSLDNRPFITTENLMHGRVLYPVAYDNGMAVFSLPAPAPKEVYAVANPPWQQCARPDPINVESILMKGAVTPAEGPGCRGVTTSKADALSRRFPAAPGVIVIFAFKPRWYIDW